MPVRGYYGELSELEPPAMLLDNSRVFAPVHENCRTELLEVLNGGIPYFTLASPQQTF